MAKPSLLDSLANVGLGLGQYLQSNRQQKAFNSIAQGPSIDPFASQRPQYQTMLSDVMSGGFDPGSLPGFSDALSFANQQIAREAASKGQFRSGNMTEALHKTAMARAYEAWLNQQQLLSQLSGANVQPNPGAATQAQLASGNAGTNAMGGLAAIAKGILGSGGGGGLLNFLSPGAGSAASAGGAAGAGSAAGAGGATSGIDALGSAQPYISGPGLKLSGFSTPEALATPPAQTFFGSTPEAGLGLVGNPAAEAAITPSTLAQFAPEVPGLTNAFATGADALLPSGGFPGAGIPAPSPATAGMPIGPNASAAFEGVLPGVESFSSLGPNLSSIGGAVPEGAGIAASNAGVVSGGGLGTSASAAIPTGGSIAPTHGIGGALSKIGSNIGKFAAPAIGAMVGLNILGSIGKSKAKKKAWQDFQGQLGNMPDTSVGGATGKMINLGGANVLTAPNFNVAYDPASGTFGNITTRGTFDPLKFSVGTQERSSGRSGGDMRDTRPFLSGDLSNAARLAEAMGLDITGTSTYSQYQNTQNELAKAQKFYDDSFQRSSGRSGGDIQQVRDPYAYTPELQAQARRRARRDSHRGR
jgi:hypothetical protein